MLEWLRLRQALGSVQLQQGLEPVQQGRVFIGESEVAGLWGDTNVSISSGKTSMQRQLTELSVPSSYQA